MPTLFIDDLTLLSVTSLGDVVFASGGPYSFPFTFSTAFPNRWMLACIGWQNSGAASSAVVTIGGVTATQLGLVSGAGGFQFGMWAALVPSNASPAVTLSTSGGTTLAGASLYDLEGVSSLNASVQSGGTVSPSATFNVPVGAAIVGAAIGAGASRPAPSWSGATMDVNAAVTSRVTLTSASETFTTAHTSYSVIGGLNSASSGAWVIVMFSP